MPQPSRARAKNHVPSLDRRRPRGEGVPGMVSRPSMCSIALGAIASLSSACAEDEDWIDDFDGDVEGADDIELDAEGPLPAGCTKVVKLHLANWAAADRLDDPRASVKP